MMIYSVDSYGCSKLLLHNSTTYVHVGEGAHSSAFLRKTLRAWWLLDG